MTDIPVIDPGTPTAQKRAGDVQPRELSSDKRRAPPNLVSSASSSAVVAESDVDRLRRELLEFKAGISADLESSRALHAQQIADAERAHDYLRAELRNAEDHVHAESRAVLNMRAAAGVENDSLRRESSALREALHEHTAQSREHLASAVSRVEADAERRHASAIRHVEHSAHEHLISEVNAAKRSVIDPGPIACLRCPVKDNRIAELEVQLDHAINAQHAVQHDAHEISRLQSELFEVRAQAEQDAAVAIERARIAENARLEAVSRAEAERGKRQREESRHREREFELEQHSSHLGVSLESLKQQFADKQASSVSDPDDAVELAR